MRPIDPRAHNITISPSESETRQKTPNNGTNLSKILKNSNSRLHRSQLPIGSRTMALWTPYADNAALDLSKASRDSPGYPQEWPGCCIPGPQLSPLSVTSVGSFEMLTPTRAMPSPPASPQRLDRDSLSDDPDFQEFERNALQAMTARNGGSLLGSNPRMRRVVHCTGDADDGYRRQRARNNLAAKQSRDRRKLREIHLALKVAYLRKELAALKGLLAAEACVRCRRNCTC